MTLSVFAAEKRRALFDDLAEGRDPREGAFDVGLLREARTKGAPQMGSTRYAPDSIAFEYIFPESSGAASVFVVTLTPPERIVFLPVPSWVVESIWQGEITGSYHFESDGMRLLAEFEVELSPESNPKWFGPQAAKRRE